MQNNVIILRMAIEISRFSPFLKQCFVTSVVGINLVGHGALMGYPAVLLPQLYKPDSKLITNKTIGSWIASAIAITLLIGSFMTPGVMDRFGRKMVHYIICILASLAWLITILAQNVEVVLVGRIVGGLSFGMMLPLRSVLIGEYTSPKNRGAFLTTVSLTQGYGVFFVHFIGSLLSWRKTALICFFLPLTSFILTIFIPESPSWLVSRRRFDESRHIFQWLRGLEEEQEIEAMIKAKMELDEANKNQKLDIIANIRKAEFYKPIIVMLHMYIITQMSGATITATYSTIIVYLIMNPKVNAEAWMVALDIERIVVNTIAIFVIHTVKRRTMIGTTIGLCIFSFVSLASYVYCKSFGILTEDILWIPGIMMVLHFMSISLGAIALPSVIAGEVFPLQYRSIAGAISLISTSSSMFLLLKTFPAMVESIDISGAYLIYAGILSYCLIIVMCLLPETKDKTLQDIEDEFRGKLVVNEAEEMRSLENSTNKNIESNSIRLEDEQNR